MSTERYAVPPEEAPSTPEELLEWPLERGDVAVHVSKPHWFFILGHCDSPAGKIPATYGGTIDEWVECDPADEIVMAVTVDRMKQSVARVDGPEDIIEAVKSDVVTPSAVPVKRLAPSLEEFVEAETRGEWDGLRDYLQEVSG